MKKEFILGIYLLVEVIYFLAAIKLSLSSFIPIWIASILINSYLLYLTLPHLKINFKSKTAPAKITIIIIILLVGALITNGPYELLGLT